jgi:hypothetical protein
LGFASNSVNGSSPSLSSPSSRSLLSSPASSTDSLAW